LASPSSALRNLASPSSASLRFLSRFTSFSGFRRFAPQTSFVSLPSSVFGLPSSVSGLPSSVFGLPSFFIF
jgi:hypothetical protein